MTSQRSEDNPTTDDWLAQRNGEYYDSIWPVDSQGRRIPPSTQITVIPSSSILDTARAAQAANRERLDRRDNNLLIEKEAVRRIKKDREKEQKDEEGKIISRGVTEGSYYTVLPKRKFGGFGWIVQEHLGEWYMSKNDGPVINSVLNKLVGSRALRKTLFQVYRLYTPLIYQQEYELPASYTTYPQPPTDQSQFIKCTVLNETKNSIALRIHGEIKSPGSPANQVETVTNTEYVQKYSGPNQSSTTTTGDEFNSTTIFQSILGFGSDGEAHFTEKITNRVKPQYSEQTVQTYYIQIGTFFSRSTLSRPSYFYIFEKESEAFSFRGGMLLSELSPETQYPTPSIATPENLNKIFIDVEEFSPTTKNNMRNNLTDVYGNQTQERTYEFGDGGNLTLYDSITTNYTNTTTTVTPYDNTTVYKGQFISNFQRITTTTFTPETKTLDHTIEIIVTEQNYGPLE